MDKIMHDDTVVKILVGINQIKNINEGEVSCSERMGVIEDYSVYQEQRDLDNYRKFMNCSDYDIIKDAGGEIPPQKKITMNDLRKIGLQHEE